MSAAADEQRAQANERSRYHYVYADDMEARDDAEAAQQRAYPHERQITSPTRGSTNTGSSFTSGSHKSVATVEQRFPAQGHGRDEYLGVNSYDHPQLDAVQNDDAHQRQLARQVSYEERYRGNLAWQQDQVDERGHDEVEEPPRRPWLWGRRRPQ